MAAFLYPEEQQKNYFHNWNFQCNRQLKSLLCEIYMIIHGHLAIYTGLYSYLFKKVQKTDQGRRIWGSCWLISRLCPQLFLRTST
ncbi:hypothetical protein L1887_03002 [Cichorium endivia]|nr:hypothetical protein L1887_03002 [Cichorium endivia]